MLSTSLFSDSFCAAGRHSYSLATLITNCYQNITQGLRSFRQHQITMQKRSGDYLLAVRADGSAVIARLVHSLPTKAFNNGTSVDIVSHQPIRANGLWCRSVDVWCYDGAQHCSAYDSSHKRGYPITPAVVMVAVVRRRSVAVWTIVVALSHHRCA